MADIEHPQEGGGNPTVRHEERDVNARAVTAAGLGIFGFTVAAVFAMWFLFNFLARRETPGEPARAAWSETSQLPPAPRLQASPAADYKNIRAAEDKLMNSYAWIDPDKGIVRIPVNRALEILAQRGIAK